MNRQPRAEVGGGREIFRRVLAGEGQKTPTSFRGAIFFILQLEASKWLER